jgi:hypothetical protein
MHPSITIDNIDIKSIELLNKSFELLINYIKSIKDNSNFTNNLINQIYQRYELRNNYYHRKYPLLLHDLCLIKSTKKHFQLIANQHYHSKQFFKKIFNIQSLSDIEQYHQQYEQSIKFLNELKNMIHQYEYDINELKQKFNEQNKQINVYLNNLFQIQFEQNHIQTNIQQLKQQILFEQRLYHQIKQQSKQIFQTNHINLQQQITLNNELQNQVHTEYNNLFIQIAQIKFNIEQQSIDLLLLQFELYIYHTIFNRESKDQSIKTNTKEIHRQSVPVLNIIHSEQQIPIKSINKSECTKFKSRKSNAKYNIFLISE